MATGDAGATAQTTGQATDQASAAPAAPADDAAKDLARMKRTLAELQKERDGLKAQLASEADAKARKDAEARGEYEKIAADLTAKLAAAEAARAAQAAEFAAKILRKDLEAALRDAGMASDIAREGAIVRYLATTEAERADPAKWAADLAADPSNAVLFSKAATPAAATGAGAPKIGGAAGSLEALQAAVTDPKKSAIERVEARRALEAFIVARNAR